MGIKLSSSEIIHFLDDDSVPANTYLQELCKTFSKYPTCAGGMGSIQNILPKPWDVDRFLRILFLLQRDHATGTFKWSGMPTHPYGTTAFKRVEVLGGCCMSYKKNILQKFMFDEKLCGYACMEDCDISRRISNFYPLFFNPCAQLEHHPSKQNRDSLYKSQSMYIHNYSYLFFKNFYPQAPIKIICYIWSIIGLFVLALWHKNFTTIQGYIHGLSFFWRRYKA